MPDQTIDLARRMYAAYIGTTGLMNYKGSSVLGLEHLRDLDDMSADELREHARTIKLDVSEIPAGLAGNEPLYAAVRTAIMCPAWPELPPKVREAWVAAASVRLEPAQIVEQLAVALDVSVTISVD